jgi:hypothetical protein
VGEQRQAPPEWLEVGPPIGRHRGQNLRRWFLAGLAAALAAVAVITAAGRSLDESADQGGRINAPPWASDTPTQQSHRPSPGPPVVLAGPTLPNAGNWEVYGRSGTEVVRLQFGSGRMTRTPVPQLDTSGRVTFLATRTGVLARPVRPAPGYQVRDGAPAQPLPPSLGRGGLILPGPEPDQVWITSTSRFSSRAEMLLASLSSGWVRVQAGLPARTYGPVRADGAGSYYVGSTGGTYLRVPGGYQRVSAGTVLAAVRGSWLTAECDERLRCRHLLVDRRKGIRREVHLLPSQYAAVTLVSLSPDSRYAAVAYRLGTQAATLHVIDLRDGADHEVAARLDSGMTEDALVWSPTADYLAVVGGQGRLLVIASATGKIVPLEADLPPLSQLAAKPR